MVTTHDLHVVWHDVVLCKVNWWRFITLLKWNWISTFKKSLLLAPHRRSDRRMNCANCSALLRRKKLISFHILNLLSLYLLLGSFCHHHHHHHHHHHFRHIVHITWRLFSILSILSCFCLYYSVLFSSVLPLKVNKVVHKLATFPCRTRRRPEELAQKCRNYVTVIHP